MYKVGLILTLIGQVIMALSMMGLSIVAGFLERLVGSFINLASIGTGVSVTITVLYIISIVITSLALSNLSKVENGTESLKSGLATTAGILWLFTTLIGGILTSVGMSDVREKSRQYRDQSRSDNRRRY